MSDDGQTRYPVSAYAVRDVPERERPRELFDRLGPENVPDSVLLAIILRSGVRGTNVIDLARHLLRRYGSLTELARVPVQDLKEVNGLGPVKAQVLKAALQLARNLAEEAGGDRPFVGTPAEAARALREQTRALEEEVFWVLLLDTRNRLMAPPLEVSRGILDASLVHPREVFKSAIRHACAAVILAHNHPSGDPSPSPEDIRVTRQVVEAGRIVEISVLDHIILGRSDGRDGQDFLSLREAGIVSFEA
jgi:DNA repair protein RadC